MSSADRSGASRGPSSEPNRRQCVDCKDWSPETETNYTLISARHGWRLTRGADVKGDVVMEWRCPDCFRRYRASTPK